MQGQGPQLWTPDYPAMSGPIRDLMALPPVDPWGPELAALEGYIRSTLGRVLGTSGAIMILPSSVGSALASLVRAFSGPRILHFVTGPDSEDWSRSSAASGKEMLRIRIPDGKAVEAAGAAEIFKRCGPIDALAFHHVEGATGALNPVREIAPILIPSQRPRLFIDATFSTLSTEIQMDRDGIDGLVAGSLGFGLPPGLCVVALGPKVLADLAEEDQDPTSLRALAKAGTLIPRVEPPCLPLIFALGARLKAAEDEGWDTLFRRHWQLAARARAFAKEHFDIATADGYSAYSFTCIKTPKASGILREAARRGLVLGPGRGSLASESLRLGHRGEATLEDLDRILDLILEVAAGLD